MIKQTNRVTKLFKKIWITFAILIILMAISSSIFRSLTPWAKQYKGDVEHRLSLLIGQPVTIQTMETGWYWFQPVLRLNQVKIKTNNDHALRLDKLLVGINLFKSLWYWQIQPGVLYIDDVHINLREHDGKWHVEGILSKSLKENEVTPETIGEILGWMSRQEKLILRHVSAHLHFSNGTLIPVSGLNLSIINRGGHYKFKGEAQLEQMNATSLQLLGDVRFDPHQMNKTQGQIYFAAKHILPAQWQSMFPKMTQRFEGGKGDVAVWMDLKNGTLSSIQSQVKFKRLAWSVVKPNNTQLIQSFFANMSWKPDESGWTFNADHIQLRVGGLTWPDNKLFVKYNKDQHAYQLYIKSIIIESLLSTAIDWPQDIQRVMQFKPQGLLSDTQVLIQSNQLQYVLTRFDQIGWNGNASIPQVSHLSGVLSWQPHQGRIELDSEHAAITVKGYPTQQLTLLNGAFSWNELANGLKLTIERFVVSQPQLTLSTEGVMDEVTGHSLGHIRLNVDFSGKNVQQWLPYLPEQSLKPKLADWLKNDIKRIAEATGKITVNGQAKDFPFDNNTGEFSIVSHASGGDVLITSKWQLIKDIEAYIRLNNRNLEFDVVNADIQGAQIKQAHLRIDDIGKDRETLLLHGIFHAPVQKLLNFVLASPLHKKLSALNMLSIKGPSLLNLRLEAPLYPENDKVLVKGDLLFKNNTIMLKHQVGQFKIDQLNGELAFDEQGVSDSTLVGSTLGYPINIHIRSEGKTKSQTTVLIGGEYPVSALKSQFRWPILSALKGAFYVNAVLKLTENPDDLDNITLKTTLEGLAIDLPAPLGKSRNTSSSLKANLDFNLKKEFHLRAQYADQLSADLLFKERNGALDLQSGELRLGHQEALNRNKAGLSVVGDLRGFDVDEWKKVFTQFSKMKSSSSLLNKLKKIHVKLDKLTYLKQNFDKLVIKANLLSEKDWALTFDQKNIAADLVYQPETFTLSGHFKRLHLARYPLSKNQHESSTNAHPMQIPNLDLRIDNLSIGSIKVGNMTLKSQSSPDKWLIDTCRIESPEYQFNILGEWTQKGKINQTQLQLQLNIHDLANSLERWEITPAVNAGKGEMEFIGGWNDTLYDFSLAGLSGTMSLKLKKGIITHLSPETEEKLGLGKLLSILSLQTIPRRLTLDFSDLSHEGYSFDIFKGTFAIKNGIMSTQDSYLDGPVAYASMKGDLDLVKRLYDLDLKISPHITASLPVVATIAGGPIVGLAAWVANKLINQGMQKITAYSYKVSGPWDEPIVQQLNIVKKGLRHTL